MTNYQKFLKSKEWKLLKSKVKKRDKCCQKCKSTERLEVHHKTYKKGWLCDMKYLILLCHRCHSMHHLSVKVNWWVNKIVVGLTIWLVLWILK